MHKISPRENILHCLRRQGYEYIPIDMELCESQVKEFERRFGHRDYSTHFGLCHRGVWFDLAPTYDDARSLYIREELPADTRFDPWGVGHSKGSDAAFHMTRMHHPLKGAMSSDEIARYPFPVVKASTHKEAAERVRSIHEKGLAAVGIMACTVWESAWYMRSMEELMLEMMTNDEKAVMLLDKVTNISCARARMYAEAGVDILHLGDDIGRQDGPLISVGLWEEWLKQRLKKVIDTARDVNPEILVFYHSCGHVTEFIEGLIEIGVDILNPVQPECMSFDAVHDLYGDRLSFWGTIGTQTTLPFGTPDDVRNVVASRLEKCGEHGGIVIGPTHIVEPEVPWENIQAMVGAVRKKS